MYSSGVNYVAVERQTDRFQSTETGCLTLNFIDYQNKPQLKSVETHILSSADGSTDGDLQQMAQQMANSFSG